MPRARQVPTVPKSGRKGHRKCALKGGGPNAAPSPSSFLSVQIQNILEVKWATGRFAGLGTKSNILPLSRVCRSLDGKTGPRLHSPHVQSCVTGPAGGLAPSGRAIDPVLQRAPGAIAGMWQDAVHGAHMLVIPGLWLPADAYARRQQGVTGGCLPPAWETQTEHQVPASACFNPCCRGHLWSDSADGVSVSTFHINNLERVYN